MDAISEGETIPPYNGSLVGSLAPSIAVLQHRLELSIVDDIAAKVQAGPGPLWRLATFELIVGDARLRCIGSSSTVRDGFVGRFAGRSVFHYWAILAR